MAQISAAITETVTLPEVYKDFKYIIPPENADYLPFYEDHDHGIDLVDGKKPLYKPIYSLSENELSIF